MCNFLNYFRFLLHLRKLVIFLLICTLAPAVSVAATFELDSIKTVATTHFQATSFAEPATENATTAKPGWVVRVKGRQDSRGKPFDCTGVAIAPNWVITSTSCTGKINLASCLEVSTVGDYPRSKGIKGFLPSYLLDPPKENLDRYGYTVIQLSDSLAVSDFPKLNTEVLDKEQLTILAQNFHLVDSKGSMANSGEYLVPVLEKNNFPSFYFTSHDEDINKLKKSNFILYTSEHGSDVLYALCASALKGVGEFYSCQSVARSLNFIESSVRYAEMDDYFPADPPENKWPKFTGQYNFTMPQSRWVPWTPGCYDPNNETNPTAVFGLIYGTMGITVVLFVVGSTMAMMYGSCLRKKHPIQKPI